MLHVVPEEILSDGGQNVNIFPSICFWVPPCSYPMMNAHQYCVHMMRFDLTLSEYKINGFSRTFKM